MDYKYTQWNSEINDALNGYIAIHDPIIQHNALEKHYETSRLIELLTLGFKSEQRDKGVVVSDADLSDFKKHYINEFVSEGMIGILIFRRQMIVISVTILEAIFKDFLSVYFYKKPDSMFSYIGEGNGLISFKEFLRFGNKDEYLKYLSNSAANRFMSQKWKSVFKKLSELTKIEIQNEDELIELVDKRNQIIHEGLKIELENEYVFDSIDLVGKLNEVFNNNLKH